MMHFKILYYIKKNVFLVSSFIFHISQLCFNLQYMKKKKDVKLLSWKYHQRCYTYQCQHQQFSIMKMEIIILFVARKTYLKKTLYSSMCMLRPWIKRCRYWFNRNNQVCLIFSWEQFFLLLSVALVTTIIRLIHILEDYIIFSYSNFFYICNSNGMCACVMKMMLINVICLK